MSDPLGVDQVRALLLDIVAEFPDGHHYEPVPWRGDKMCVYSVDGRPSCLIGHLFHRLGVVVPEWHQSARVARIVPGYAGGMFTSDAVIYMSNVQQSQDAHMPWADCVKLADNLMIDLELSRLADDAATGTV